MNGLHADIEFHRPEFDLRAALDVPAGEVLAVLGPNGAGKSTLLAVLSGLLAPDRGRVVLGQSAEGREAQVAGSPGLPARAQPAQEQLARGRSAQERLDQAQPTQGQPTRGEPGQDHPAQGHQEQGHPAQGHQEQGHPAQGHPEQGERVWCDAERRIHVPTHRRNVGLLAQNPLLFPNMSALENVAFGPRAGGARKAAARDIARDWLSEVDAAELAARRPAQLSGGQAQRVALARALAATPELLLLDEPLAALDVDAAPAIRSLLHRVLNAQRQPTVLVTHDVLDAVVLADRVAVLVDGRIIEQGPTREVLARPKAAFTARIAGLNLLTGPAADGGLEFDGIALHGRTAEPIDQGEPAAAVCAPAAVAVHRERPHASPRNAVPVVITALEPRGDVVRLRAETRTESQVALAADVTPAAVAELALTQADEVFFVVKAAEVAIHPLSGGSSGA